MNTLARVRAWLAGHRRQVLVGAGVGVGGYALYRAHQAGGLGLGSSSTGTSVAGLTAAPPADATGSGADPNGQLAAGLAQIAGLLNNRLPVPKPGGKPTPKPPPALPKPGSNRYVIRKGDTLAKISQALYGVVTAGTIGRLRTANPTLFHFGNADLLNNYAGDRINIPQFGGPQPKPKPKPQPNAKPKPKPVKTKR